MFTTLSRRTTILIASSLAVTTAGTFAIVQSWDTPPAAVTEADDHTAAPQTPRPSRQAAVTPVVHPRPGEVAACEEPGEEEIVQVPDEGAPNGKRPVWIRRPPGADSDDVPVLYLLHGSTGTHHDIIDADVGPLMDKEMCRTGVEFVIAAPHGQEEQHTDTEWGDAVHGRFNIETFVTEKAIEVVEGEQRRPQELRAIGGFSMGGYGSAALSLRNPDTYSQVVSWGGYFRVDDPSGTFGDDTDAHAPDLLIDDPRAADIRFKLIEGAEDRTPLQEGSIHGEAERFSALLRERGMTVETAFPPGGHDFATWTPTFPDAVDFLVEGWTASEADRD